MSLVTKPPTFSIFKKLAYKRSAEAEVLFKNKKYSGAYYLAGYCIELALKAKYSKQTKRNSFPPVKDIYNILYSHNLNKLLEVSGLSTALANESKNNTVLGTHWGVIKDWSEDSRYQEIPKNEAESLLRAINDKSNGLLNWISKHW